VKTRFISCYSVFYPSSDVASVAFSPDGKTLASGGSGGDDETIKLWNLDSNEEIAIFGGHSGMVYSVAFSPDSKTLASGGDDETIKLWNLENNHEIATLKRHSHRVYSVGIQIGSILLLSVPMTRL
jgi:WD40 repeat protein